MKILFLILFLILMSGCSAKDESALLTDPTPIQSPIDTQIEIPETFVSDTPKSAWRPIFHEEIDKVSSTVKVIPLRISNVPEHDIEVRVWAGFGKSALKGFILKRTDKIWNAAGIGIHREKNEVKYARYELAEPVIGWQSAWTKLLRNDILNMPDAAKLNCNPSSVDGYSYVVEIKKGESYRTYMYENPWTEFKNRCKQADLINAIAEIIMNDFGVENFRHND